MASVQGRVSRARVLCAGMRSAVPHAVAAAVVVVAVAWLYVLAAIVVPVGAPSDAAALRVCCVA